MGSVIQNLSEPWLFVAAWKHSKLVKRKWSYFTNAFPYFMYLLTFALVGSGMSI
jgi:hypothetical protein